MQNTKSEVLNYVESVIDLAIEQGDVQMLEQVQEQLPNIFGDIAMRIYHCMVESGEIIELVERPTSRMEAVQSLFLECDLNDIHLNH